MRSVLTIGATAVALAVTALSSQTLVVAAGQREAKAVPSSPKSIKDGSAVYAKYCRSCHGLRGRGDGIAAPPGTKPANLVDSEWKHAKTDPEIFKIIRTGIEPFTAMRPQKGMTDVEIWSVIHFLRDLGAAKK